MSICNFKDKYGFLSNMFKCNFNYRGLDYMSSEAAFQSMKTTDLNLRKKISEMYALEAKKFGKTIKIRDNWEQIKELVMLEINLEKFTQSSWLKNQLLKTGDEELVEGNSWGDTFWGVCHGKGLNRLGHVLMTVRIAINSGCVDELKLEVRKILDSMGV